MFGVEYRYQLESKGRRRMREVGMSGCVEGWGVTKIRMLKDRNNETFRALFPSYLFRERVPFCSYHVFLVTRK